jgi:NAD(P)-dependent dehydrogenase (short-subunit alcohol dehydrogenase family)
MLTVQLSAELLNSKIVVNSVSPGYVKTDLTEDNGLLTPDQAAKRQLNSRCLEMMLLPAGSLVRTAKSRGDRLNSRRA